MRIPALLVAPFLLATPLPGCDRAELDTEARQRVAALGDTAVASLVQTLGGRLREHLAAGGPERAIAFCSTEAQSLTDSVSAALGAGWEVRRTTRRTRNPANAPDSLETEALAYFHGAVEAGDTLPGHYVQPTPAGDYRYYTPLRIGGLCLQCHGPESELDPAVRSVLTARYPDDEATGHAPGDLRGVVRVTIPREAIR